MDVGDCQFLFPHPRRGINRKRAVPKNGPVNEVLAYLMDRLSDSLNIRLQNGHIKSTFFPLRETET